MSRPARKSFKGNPGWTKLTEHFKGKVVRGLFGESWSRTIFRANACIIILEHAPLVTERSAHVNSIAPVVSEDQPIIIILSNGYIIILEVFLPGHHGHQPMLLYFYYFCASFKKFQRSLQPIKGNCDRLRNHLVSNKVDYFQETPVVELLSCKSAEEIKCSSNEEDMVCWSLRCHLLVLIGGSVFVVVMIILLSNRCYTNPGKNRGN